MRCLSSSALRITGLLLAATIATAGHAAAAKIEARVVRTLTTDGVRFGGCMVQLDRRIAVLAADLAQPVVLNCPGSWVTFSCSGTHTSKDAAERMFESAKSAFSLEKTIVLEVTDTKKHHGHCYAQRVDVKKN